MSMITSLAEAAKKQIVGSPALTPAPGSVAEYATKELTNIINGQTVVDGEIMHRLVRFVGNAKEPEVAASWAVMLLSTDRKDPWAAKAARVLHKAGVSKHDIGVNWSAGLSLRSIPVVLARMVDEDFEQKRMEGWRLFMAKRDKAKAAIAKAMEEAGVAKAVELSNPVTHKTANDGLPAMPPVELRTTDRKEYDRQYYHYRMSRIRAGTWNVRHRRHQDKAPVVQVQERVSVPDKETAKPSTSHVDNLRRMFGDNTYAKLVKMAEQSELPITTIIRTFVVEGLLRQGR